MRSNKIMKRQMGEYDVLQRTSDSYFNLNGLLSQWNSTSGNSRRRLDKFMDSPNTKKFIKALEDDLANGTIGPKADNQLVKHIKGKCTSVGRTPDEVWAHPFIFLKFAMFLNPKFEVQVIKFVYDELISLRCDAGDNYTQLMKRVYGFTDCDFGKVAIAINWVVFNEHCKQRRDSGTLEQMKGLKQLEGTLCSMIDTGLVNSQIELIEVLRKMYDNKYRKF